MRIVIVCTLALITVVVPTSFVQAAKVRNDYELTVAVVVKALDGWRLYRDQKFDGSYNGGHYTNPDPKTQVKDFWSDGRFANLDRDDDGFFETRFIIKGRQLEYVGSLGSSSRFIDVANEFKEFMNCTAASFEDAQK